MFLGAVSAMRPYRILPTQIWGDDERGGGKEAGQDTATALCELFVTGAAIRPERILLMHFVELPLHWGDFSRGSGNEAGQDTVKSLYRGYCHRTLGSCLAWWRQRGRAEYRYRTLGSC